MGAHLFPHLRLLKTLTTIDEHSSQQKMFLQRQKALPQSQLKFDKLKSIAYCNYIF